MPAQEVIPEQEAAQAPPLEGRHVVLRPVVPSDYETLYRMAMLPEVAHRWRTEGSTPNPAAFQELLWRDVLVQFLAVNRADGAPMGLVTCFAANHREGFAHVALMTDPRFALSGLVLAPFALLLNYVFALWNFRKLYMESAQFNYLKISSGEGRFFHEEGRLKDHVFYGDRYWDLHILALYREDWEKYKQGPLRLALPRSERHKA